MSLKRICKARRAQPMQCISKYTKRATVGCLWFFFYFFWSVWNETTKFVFGWFVVVVENPVWICRLNANSLRKLSCNRWNSRFVTRSGFFILNSKVMAREQRILFYLKLTAIRHHSHSVYYFLPGDFCKCLHLAMVNPVDLLKVL